MKTKTPLLIRLTRIAVGGVLLAVDQLNESLVESEENRESPSTRIIDVPDQVDSSNEFRDGLIGLVFDVENQIHENLGGVDRFTRRIAKKSNQLMRPITSSRFVNPITKKFDKLVGRGEDVWEKWVDIGRYETQKSKVIVARSVNENVDFVIDQMAEKPEVRELVQSQGVGLAGEIVEELRERSISADTFLETITRNILRLQPRDIPLKASEQVVEQAKPIRRLDGKVIKK